MLDAFFLRLAEPNLRLRLCDVPVHEVYNATGRSSNLRDLLATVLLHTGTIKDIEKCENQLPKAFLVECLRVAKEDGVVPFAKRGREGEEWMERKRERIGGEYHVHDEDERGRWKVSGSRL